MFKHNRQCLQIYEQPFFTSLLHMTRVRKKDDSAEVRKVTWVGLAWNAALSIAKFVVGTLGNSQALVADAIHSASDFITDIAVIVGSHFWNSPPDAEHPYGHRRFETLITICIGIAVAVVGILCFNLFGHLIESTLEVDQHIVHVDVNYFLAHLF